MVYEFCCKNRDIAIWCNMQHEMQMENEKEVSSTDELSTTINDFIINHIELEVLKVKLRR